MSGRIGIFGGTFDPVHTGHLSIASSFLKSGHIEQLWILPSPDPPHKDLPQLTPFRHRLAMLERVFADVDDVVISDIENQLSPPFYTVKTLAYLKNHFPGKIFLLCIGEDSLAGFDSWYRSGDILKEHELLVAERPGYDTAGVSEKILQKTRFVAHDPVEVSSSELRQKLEKDMDLNHLIPEEVLDYITQEKLYR